MEHDYEPDDEGGLRHDDMNCRHPDCEASFRRWYESMMAMAERERLCANCFMDEECAAHIKHGCMAGSGIEVEGEFCDPYDLCCKFGADVQCPLRASESDKHTTH